MSQSQADLIWLSRQPSPRRPSLTRRWKYTCSLYLHDRSYWAPFLTYFLSIRRETRYVNFAHFWKQFRSFNESHTNTKQHISSHLYHQYPRRRLYSRSFRTNLNNSASTVAASKDISEILTGARSCNDSAFRILDIEIWTLLFYFYFLS